MKKKSLNILISMLYIFGTILAGSPLLVSSMQTGIPRVYFISFIVLLLGAKFIKGTMVMKYFLAYIAIIVIFTTIISYKPDFELFSLIMIIIIVAFLLPDFYSPFIVAICIIITFHIYRPDEIMGGVLGTITMSFLSTIISFLMRRTNKQRDKYYQLSITDSLTGLYTLNYILQEGQTFLECRNNVSMLVIDINDFKQINDTYGHITGNHVIVQFSELLKSITCDYERIIGRLGGDEFIVLLCQNDSEQLDKLIRKLHQEINSNLFLADTDLAPIAISCSIGKAEAKDLSIMNIQELLKIADIDMYYNKHEKYKILKDMDIDRISIPTSCLSYLKSIQEKDMYTFIHSQYAAYFAYLMAKEMQLPQKTIEDLFIAGWLHDIGKMLIPNIILRKPGVLSDEEFNTIKEHVILGVDLLSSIDLSDTVKNAIMQHHERWDGGGYPYGITAENITIEGRIMQIADTFSALTIKRIYKPLLQLEEAIKEIQSNAGTQFDPNLVNLLTGIMQKDCSSNSLLPSNADQIKDDDH